MNSTLLISSCDAYSDCWLPLLHSLHRHWPGCPYPVALICNTAPEANLFSATSADTAFSPRFLPVGPDRGWGPNLALALGSVETEFVIYLQEDYFLDHLVSSEAMEQHLEYCHTNAVDYLRLGWPWQDRQKLTPMYCDDAFSFRYALCLQPAIWRTSVLKQLSSKVNDGWEFERNIKQYIRDEQLSIRARVLHSSAYPDRGLKVVDGTGIRKGLWTRGGERYLNENGFGELVAGRGVEGAVTDWLMHRVFLPVKIPAVLLLRVMKRLKINW